jgi:hypothetical protein
MKESQASHAEISVPMLESWLPLALKPALVHLKSTAGLWDRFRVSVWVPVAKSNHIVYQLWKWIKVQFHLSNNTEGMYNLSHNFAVCVLLLPPTLEWHWSHD